MTDLKSHLDDLLADVPRHVVRSDLAATAAVAGSRRRRRRRVAVLVGAVTAVAAVAGLGYAAPRLLAPQPASTGGGAGVDGFPSRIAMPWRSRTVPDAPGPMAGVAALRVTAAPWSWWVADGWYALSPGGALWRIPVDKDADAAPALSPDGRYLGYVEDGGPYVIRDLVSGRHVEFADVGGPVPGSSRAYRVAPQSPAFWSPDSAQLLVRAVSTQGGPDVDLLLGRAGTWTTLPARGLPAGWLGASTLVRLDPEGPGSPAGLGEVVVTDLAGTELRGYFVASPPGGEPDQWSTVAAADGKTVLVSRQVAQGLGTTAYGIASRSLQSGDEVVTPGGQRACLPSVGAQRVAVTTTIDGRSGLEALGGGSLPLIDPRLDVSCLTLARDAVDGVRHHGLIDRLAGGGSVDLWDEDSWWAWHLRELGLAVAAGFAALLAVWLRWRRRRVVRSLA